MSRRRTAILAAVGVVFATGIVSAHFSGPLTGNQFQTACIGVEGTLSDLNNGGQVQPGTKCTWEEIDTSTVATFVPPGQGEEADQGTWTLTVEETITHVATWNNASSTGIGNTDTVTSSVTECRNPGGNVMSLTHPHCQL